MRQSELIYMPPQEVVGPYDEIENIGWQFIGRLALRARAYRRQAVMFLTTGVVLQAGGITLPVIAQGYFERLTTSASGACHIVGAATLCFSLSSEIAGRRWQRRGEVAGVECQAALRLAGANVIRGEVLESRQD